MKRYVERREQFVSSIQIPFVALDHLILGLMSHILSRIYLQRKHD